MKDNHYCGNKSSLRLHCSCIICLQTIPQSTADIRVLCFQSCAHYRPTSSAHIILVYNWLHAVPLIYSMICDAHHTRGIVSTGSYFLYSKGEILSKNHIFPFHNILLKSALAYFGSSWWVTALQLFRAVHSQHFMHVPRSRPLQTVDHSIILKLATVSVPWSGLQCSADTAKPHSARRCIITMSTQWQLSAGCGAPHSGSVFVLTRVWARCT